MIIKLQYICGGLEQGAMLSHRIVEQYLSMDMPD